MCLSSSLLLAAYPPVLYQYTFECISLAHSLSFTGIHDGSKCADKGSDCCASALWGEKPACKDGYTPTTTGCQMPHTRPRSNRYIPIATGANGCPSSYKHCKSFYNGAGCFGCYPPMKGQG